MKLEYLSNFIILYILDLTQTYTVYIYIYTYSRYVHCLLVKQILGK